MRILIFSDLHAHWEALLWMQQVEPEPDAVFFLGDIIGFGPDPAACLHWVRANATVAVQGNHDYGLVNNVCGGTAIEVHDLALATQAYAWKILHKNDVAYLASLPQQKTVTMAGTTFHLVHGTPMEPMHGKANLLFSRQSYLREILGEVEADVFLMGNTHIPALRQVDGKLLVNPGSLGQPRYGVPDPTYAIWEDGDVRIRHLHMPHDRTIEKIGLLPLEDEIIKRLQQILMTGQMVLPEGMTAEELKRKHEMEHGAYWLAGKRGQE
jgi:putative phosphoesterase